MSNVNRVESSSSTRPDEKSTSLFKSHPEQLRKLLNFLKLPKAQRWISCEWFYSDIDRFIFESENDFALCLKQSFPQLRTTNLRRKQWCIVRRLIGKPRRCSDAFFQEERQMLEEKRHKIRMIQQRKLTEQDLMMAGGDLKDLPGAIPLPLSIGNRVFAHITRPEEGVFLGTIAAVDPVEHTYRVVFDRASLGSQTLADYEIKSLNPPVQAIPLRAYLQTYRPKMTPISTGLTPNASMPASVNLQSFLFLNTPRFGMGQTPLSTSNILMDDLNNPAIAAALAFHSNLDPMIGLNSPLKLSNVASGIDLLATPLKDTQAVSNMEASSASVSANVGANAAANVQSPINALYGNFPIQLLLMVTRLNKILLVKRDLVKKLSQMNSDAERIKANGQPYTSDFQISYASLVLDLEKLNKDLSEYLNGVESFTNSGDESTVAAATSRVLTESGSESEHDTTSNSQASSSHFHITQLDSSNTTASKITSKEACLRESVDLVSRLNNESGGAKLPRSGRTVDMVVRLTSLLLQVKKLMNANANLIEQRLEQAREDGDNQEEIENSAAAKRHHFMPFSTKQLVESLNEIKNGLGSNENVKLFEDNVLVHMNHIESVLCHYNKLNAFKSN